MGKSKHKGESQGKDRKCSWDLLLDFPVETTHACIHTHTHTYTNACTYIYIGRVSMGYQQQLNNPWCGETPITSIHKILRLNSRLYPIHISSVQSLSHGPTLCDPMNHSTPGLPVHHQLLEFTETHVHWVSDALQPSHPLSSPSPAPNPSQHQSPF